MSASREGYGVAASRCRRPVRRPGTIRRQPVSRYRQGGSGQERSGHGRCGHGGCDRNGSGPSPAASVPFDRCKGQRGIDLGHGSPDGRRGLAVDLAEQLGCLCGGFLGLAEVLFYVHWPSSCLGACYWSDTALRRSANCSRARNAEVRPAGDRASRVMSGLVAAVIVPDMLHIGSRTVPVAVLRVMTGKKLARDPIGIGGAAVAAGLAGDLALGQPLSDAVAIEEISRLMGHSSSNVTETVYRHQIRPVITTGAEAMDKISPTSGNLPHDTSARKCCPPTHVDSGSGSSVWQGWWRRDLPG